MGVVANASDAVSNEEEEQEDPLDSIFSSRGSVNLGDIPNFSSTDLTAAAAAIMASPDDSDHDIEILSSTSSSSSSSGEDEELGEFLWDAMAGFDPAVRDLADLCPTSDP